MSLANKKRSWEDHVTNWPVFSFDSVDSGAVCCHGLMADNLNPSMESNEVSKLDKQERFSSISLPECCHNPESFDFQEKKLCDHRKEVDENDNHESEERCLPLEASTETLVHVSDENADLSSEDDQNASEELDSGQEQTLVEITPVLKIKPVARSMPDNFEIVVELDYDLVPEEDKEEDIKVSVPTESSEVIDMKDLPKRGVDKNLDVEDINASTEVLPQTAVVAQQQRKHEASEDKDESEFTKDVLESSVDSCLAADSDVRVVSVVTPVERIIEAQTCPRESCNEAIQGEVTQHVGESQDDPPCQNDPANVSKQDPPVLNLQENTTNCDPADCTIKLRKRKEIRDERDRARLDSMVLLIMKLDQLDQDIENALSSNSSPSNTPTVKRRQIPERESDSESGADAIAISQNQKVHLVHSSFGSGSPKASSGAKPKTGDEQSVTEVDCVPKGQHHISFSFQKELPVSQLGFLIEESY
ncbi:rho GTPase-activating protein 7-like [Callorhinchus milii]|uniref:rho GTPase-activating protein 7-like n=1 Tax=Callorhinchus milii TaxID=7868 RepID=UPI001C3F8030|nr:rho GTPase-activating protein 7-like [Callorhinchus milii]